MRSSVRSLPLKAVAVARRSRRRCLRRRAGAPGAGLVVPPRSQQRGARPPLLRGGDSLSLHVLGGSRSLRAVVSAVTSSLGAVAVARHSRRRYLRRRAGALGAGLVVPPRSWRRGAQPLRCRSGGSLRRSLSRAITQVASRPRRLPLHPEENPSTWREAPALRTFAQRAAIPVWFSPLLEKEHAAPWCGPPTLTRRPRRGVRNRRRMRLRLTEYSSIKLSGRMTLPPGQPRLGERDPLREGSTRPPSQLGNPPRSCSTTEGVYTPSVPLARKPTTLWSQE